MNRDICQVSIIHQDRVALARQQMPPEYCQENLAALFKLLGDSTRLRLLLALSAAEMCVCDLAALLESTSSAVSHQLRLLRTANLVKNRKEGKMVYYSLEDERVRSLIAEGVAHEKSE